MPVTFEGIVGDNGGSGNIITVSSAVPGRPASEDLLLLVIGAVSSTSGFGLDINAEDTARASLKYRCYNDGRNSYGGLAGEFGTLSRVSSVTGYPAEVVAYLGYCDLLAGLPAGTEIALTPPPAGATYHHFQLALFSGASYGLRSGANVVATGTNPTGLWTYRIDEYCTFLSPLVGVPDGTRVDTRDGFWLAQRNGDKIGALAGAQILIAVAPMQGVVSVDPSAAPNPGSGCLEGPAPDHCDIFGWGWQFDTFTPVNGPHDFGSPAWPLNTFASLSGSRPVQGEAGCDFVNHVFTAPYRFTFGWADYAPMTIDTSYAAPESLGFAAMGSSDCAGFPIVAFLSRTVYLRVNIFPGFSGEITDPEFADPYRTTYLAFGVPFSRPPCSLDFDGVHIVREHRAEPAVAPGALAPGEPAHVTQTRFRT